MWWEQNSLQLNPAGVSDWASGGKLHLLKQQGNFLEGCQYSLRLRTRSSWGLGCRSLTEITLQKQWILLLWPQVGPWLYPGQEEAAANPSGFFVRAGTGNPPFPPRL